MRDIRVRTQVLSRGDSGFALVLAIMALMLLTFLGLTLATTTSTELQIATNYRWSQQALYNAEAGLEASKTMLAAIPPATSWATILPGSRGATSWTVPFGTAPGQPTLPAGQSATDQWGNPLRNFENDNCDVRGGNVGYGVILEIPTSGEGPIQNKTTLFGQNLNGAVTVWVRRGLTLQDAGTIVDDSSEIGLILTAEGSAPFSGGDISSAFAQANRATRTLEVSLMRLLAPGGGSPCEAYRAQTGNGVSGSGFAACNEVTVDCSGGGGGQEDSLFGQAFSDAARAVGGTHAHAEQAAGTFGSLSAGGNCVQ